jgi:DNA-binding transcriptional regulator YiaG
MVPLFREASVLPILTQSLGKLDYPASKLQLLLVFEETDAETIAAAKALRLPDKFEFILVPHSMPLTKPNFRVAFLTVQNLKLSAKKARPIVMVGEGLRAHLLYARKLKGLTQTAAAAALGVSGATYYDWEEGTKMPSPTFWPSIIAFMGYDPICANPQSLNEKLDALQRRMGLTRRALGGKIGVSCATLHNWEIGKTKPRGRAFAALQTLMIQQLPQP